jgi:hypothetical protein
MGYRNFFKRNISSPTSKRNKPVLFIFMIKLLNAVSIQRIFSLFSHNDRVKWISISFFLMLIWRRIFLFFFSISISKKKSAIFQYAKWTKKQAYVYTRRMSIMHSLYFQTKLTKVCRFVSLSFSSILHIKKMRRCPLDFFFLLIWVEWSKISRFMLQWHLSKVSYPVFYRLEKKTIFFVHDILFI